MALTYHPKTGAIVLCNYDTGFRKPEMVKTRPAIVISPRLRKRDKLCTVVPLSTTEPETPHPYHCELTFDRPLPRPWTAERCWVIADMLATVGLDRLDRIGIGRDQYGKRKYLDTRITAEELHRIRGCVLHALGLSRLTEHL